MRPNPYPLSVCILFLSALSLACPTGEDPWDDDTGGDDDASGDDDTSGGDDDTTEDDCEGISSSSGCIVGLVAGGQEQFLGVPYAEPPVGPLRWARPQPVAAWDETLEATALGPSCMQAADDVFSGEGFGDGDEDCLTLNVFRPEGAVGLPILFFVHGGGLASGGGGWDVYADSPRLAEEAVLVTINYRLGPFGFMAHPELSAADPEGVSGNLGIFDAILALQWVNENAVALGGDPTQIMAFGESGGGRLVSVLTAAPGAEGFFDAAIIQSAPRLREVALDEAEAFGLEVQAAVGCDDVACMRAVSADEINAAGEAELGLFTEGHDYAPVIDGVLLDGAWIDQVAGGGLHDVTVVWGVNDDEAYPFAAGWWVGTEDRLENWLRTYGLALGIGDRDALVELYSADTYGSPDAAFNAFYGDAFVICPARHLLASAPPALETRAYLWRRHAEVLEDWGAFHGVELFFLFGTYPQYLDAQEEALAEVARAAWASVARGDPQVAGHGEWPAHDGDHWMVFDLEPTSETGVREEVCDFMASEGWTGF